MDIAEAAAASTAAATLHAIAENVNASCPFMCLYQKKPGCVTLGTLKAIASLQPNMLACVQHVQLAWGTQPRLFVQPYTQPDSIVDFIDFAQQAAGAGATAPEHTTYTTLALHANSVYGLNTALVAFELWIPDSLIQAIVQNDVATAQQWLTSMQSCPSIVQPCEHLTKMAVPPALLDRSASALAPAAASAALKRGRRKKACVLPPVPSSGEPTSLQAWNPSIRWLIYTRPTIDPLSANPGLRVEDIGRMALFHALWSPQSSLASLMKKGIPQLLAESVAYARSAGATFFTFDGFYVAPSRIPGAGLGLYSLLPMNADTEVGYVPGRAWAAEDWYASVASDPPDRVAARQAYSWFTGMGTVIDPIVHPTAVQPPEGHILARLNEPSPPWSPNCFAIEDTASGQVLIATQRLVLAHEELLVVYGCGHLHRSNYIVS